MITNFCDFLIALIMKNIAGNCSKIYYLTLIVYARYLRKYITTLLLLFTKHWSVHLTATLSNLDQFEIFFCTAETGNKLYRLSTHLLTYYRYVNSISQIAVNHFINEWRQHQSACVNAEGGHF